MSNEGQVEILERRVCALLRALAGLAHVWSDGDSCWCDVAIGNPMVTSHTIACERAREATAGNAPANREQGVR